MENIINIQNNRNYKKLIAEQLGQIIGIEIAIIICAFLVNIEIVLFLQIIVLPVILILIVAKYNKPIISVRIDSAAKIFTFQIAKIGRKYQIVNVPFDDILIVQKWKWLLNAYQEVLEIRSNDITKIVNPLNKANSQFINQFMSEIYKMRDLELIKGKQVSIFNSKKH